MSRVSVVLSIPVLGIKPKEGLHPYMPQKLAGRTIEPAVCVPSATGTIPNAIATADPLDDALPQSPHRRDPLGAGLGG